VQIKIATSVVLQSVGFAITSAEEEYATNRHNITHALVAAVGAGEVIDEEDQKTAAEAIKRTEHKIIALKRIKFMAEYTAEESVTLDADSFALLEANLPQR
jgi:hypothetical protein